MTIEVKKKKEIDWSEVIAEAESYLSWLDDGVDLHSKRNTIFEVVMGAIYGPEVWEYIGQQITKLEQERVETQVRHELAKIKILLEQRPELKEELFK